MRLIDADEAKKLERIVTLKPSERVLFRLMLDRMPTYEPPNAPLTLEEMREMEGEPVWIHSFSSVQKKTRISGWAIMETTGDANATFVRAGVNSRTKKWFANYGCTWLAYRRKPEEGTK